MAGERFFRWIGGSCKNNWEPWGKILTDIGREVPFTFRVDGAGHWRFHEHSLKQEIGYYNQNSKSKAAG